MSVVALATSVRANRKQNRAAVGQNQLPVVLDAFQASHAPGWIPAEEYVLTRLETEHEPDRGYRALPENAREHAAALGLFYDDLGKLVAHHVVEKELVIGAYGGTIVRVWDALAPYVYAERRLYGNHFWIYFEHLAALTATTSPESVYAQLRSRPPTPRP